MKAFVATCLLAASLSPALGASATTTRSATRPLVRYLTATLHLRRHKARLVARAMQRNPLGLTCPEQIGERLRPVLSAAQFEHYTILRDNVASYEMLNRLTAQR